MPVWVVSYYSQGLASEGGCAPTRVERYTVLRSPFIDKKSREQFEIRTHKRLIYISEPTPQTVDSLSSLNMPAGVDIRIKA